MNPLLLKENELQIKELFNEK
jgi:hypothetical protein